MNEKKASIINLISKVLFYSGAIYFFELCSKRRKDKKVRILMFHSIRDTDGDFTIKEKLISACPRVFREQISYLKNKYNIISLDAYVSMVRSGDRPPENSVIITFDDGYKDIYTNAFPILLEFEVPATVFLITAYIDSSKRFWLDRITWHIDKTTVSEVDVRGLGKFRLLNYKQKLKALNDLSNRLRPMNETERNTIVEQLIKKLGTKSQDAKFKGSFLSWGEVREMSNRGISFGSHTVSHPILANLSDEEIKLELLGSKRRIEKETSKLVELFAYPYGGSNDFNERVKKIVKDAGFSSACSTVYGRTNPNDDLYHLKRIPIFHYHNMSVFKAKVSGLLDYFDKLEDWLDIKSQYDPEKK